MTGECPLSLPRLQSLTKLLNIVATMRSNLSTEKQRGLVVRTTIGKTFAFAATSSTASAGWLVIPHGARLLGANLLQMPMSSSRVQFHNHLCIIGAGYVKNKGVMTGMSLSHRVLVDCPKRLSGWMFWTSTMVPTSRLRTQATLQQGICS